MASLLPPFAPCAARLPREHRGSECCPGDSPTRHSPPLPHLLRGSTTCRDSHGGALRRVASVAAIGGSRCVSGSFVALRWSAQCTSGNVLCAAATTSSGERRDAAASPGCGLASNVFRGADGARNLGVARDAENPGGVRGQRGAGLCALAALHGPDVTSEPLRGSVGEGKLPRTWSNPRGEVLTEVVPGLMWTADRPFVWNGIDTGGRMGVVRLQDGSVWVHSPVQHDPLLRDAVAEIGPVRHIVSPNFEHCKFAQQWISAYPEAAAYACPGLRERRPDIGYSASVGEGNLAPEEWLGEFSVTFLNFERNPFTGKPFFNEVVFSHAPSGALFVTDYFWNYPTAGLPPGSALWKIGMDKVYLPFYRSLMVTDKDLFRGSLDRVLSQSWDKLVPCHGYIIEHQAKAALAEHILVQVDE